MDGAGPVQTFFRITLPLLRPTLLFVLVVSTVTGLQSFSEPQVLLQTSSNDSTFAGGPGHAGRTMVLYFFQQTFDNNDFGYGAAMAWGIFLVVVLFSIINWRLVQRRGDREDAPWHPSRASMGVQGSPCTSRWSSAPALGLPVLLDHRHVDAQLTGDLLVPAEAAAGRTSWRTSATSSTTSTSSGRCGTRCWSRWR